MVKPPSTTLAMKGPGRQAAPFPPSAPRGQEARPTRTVRERQSHPPQIGHLLPELRRIPFSSCSIPGRTAWCTRSPGSPGRSFAASSDLRKARNPSCPLSLYITFCSRRVALGRTTKRISEAVDRYQTPTSPHSLDLVHSRGYSC